MGFSGIDCANPFVLIYYYAQSSGFPLFIFSAGVGKNARFGDVGFVRDAQLGHLFVLAIIEFINNYDPVHMIGHDNKFPQSGKWKMIGDFDPKFLGDIPDFGSLHFPISNIPEKTFPVLGANSNKIRRIPSIIPGL